ncbi:MAG: VWA domain-containing protein, partial [Anaerolineales bacterium]|nr:VWA domain-containing protein [Anaerolineales bacterium]
IIEMDVRERHEIEILDGNGFPVLAAELTFANPDGEIVHRVRTHSDGRAYFFPNLLAPEFQSASYTVNVLADYTQLIDTFTLERNDELEQRWLRETAYEPVTPLATKLDIFFVIDATGSMGDEIQQLKENMSAIATRLDALDASSLVRYGMTVYRDRGDDFTSQTYQFTADVGAFAAALAEVEAAGGGDYPEDMHEGLQKSLQVADWSVNNTISLLFVIGDAPPHLDYDDQAWTYDVAALEAAARGIKIFPIASSGLDEQGEYIYRQLAQVTGRKFLFLTYGAAGAGTLGNNTDLAVSDYDVTSLDGLITKIIEEELSFRGRS